MSYKHGITTVEAATSMATPIESGTVQVIIGVAPINLGNPDNVNKPVVIRNFAEFVKEFGYVDASEWDKYSLCRAAYMNFGVFNNSPIVFINVLDPKNSAHIKADNNEEITVSASAETVATLPNTALLSSIAVTAGGATLNEGSDYTVSVSDAGVITITFPAMSASTKVKVSYSTLKPSAITANDIIGADTVGAEKGIGAIRKVFPKTGLVPSLILAPGWSHNKTVAVKLQSTAIKINGSFKAMAIVDLNCDTVKNYTDVREAKAKFVVAANTIVCWPKIKVDDNTFTLSEAVAALMQSNDAENGDIPYGGPSNLSLRATAVVIEDGTELLLDEEQANEINAVGVLTAINNGVSFVAWGNNTSAYPNLTDVKDRYIMVRRMFIYFENSFITTYRQKVDNPMNFRLVEAICDSENIKFNSLVARNIIAGGKIQYIESENPTADLLNGRLKLHTYYAPFTPAEYIENTVEYDVEALKGALGG